jgi:hypothetical protein
MRYYRITLTDKDGNPIQFQSFGKILPLDLAQAGQQIEPGVITSLLADGSTNPAALNVEVDIHQMPMHYGDTRSYVRIYGLDLRDIYRRDLNPSFDGKTSTKISLEVGMAAGLPLANPKQRGLVMQGTIWQAFGNWLGTDMTLDLVFAPGGLTGTPPGFSATPPQPYPFTWTKGQKLSEAINATINNNQVLADLKKDMSSISDDRTANEDKHGFYFSLTEFAQLIQRLTFHQRGNNDQGVMLSINRDTIKGSDTSTLGANANNPTKIEFNDLIGQVTWFEPFKLVCKLVMRGDIDVGSYVTLPQGIPVQASSGALTSIAPRPQDQLGVPGTFWVGSVHHWGNYRQPDAMSWNTTLELWMMTGT